MKASSTFFATLLAGFVRASELSYDDESFKAIFGDIMTNGFALHDIYFTIRLDWEPKNSTLYRFNLTNGRLSNIGDHLKPTNEHCSIDSSNGIVAGRCHFDLKGAAVTYQGYLSYGRPIRQNFTVYASITDFIHGRHHNPAFLTVFFIHLDECDLRDCLITNFQLKTSTIPVFRNFTFDKFQNNGSLADEVWHEFNVKMFTHVRLNVTRAINYTCLVNMAKRKVPTSLLSRAFSNRQNNEIYMNERPDTHL
ncbi:uncharacterized protein LOC119372139 [Rhipicephalus sanguineus]|uniref:uncharacterized protein LOC119372139 n=1 Tax=Rhipicephalus sanguineus TaxID=34632 RepID=UPI001895CDDE|nr:uncharacterized protein LOC119372139 [Rhipicephalus sanguineus]